MRSLLALFVLTAAVSGCTTHQCDASSMTADGGMVTQIANELVFQSGDPAGEWIPFHGNETVTFNYPAGFRDPYTWNTFISTSQAQDAGNFTFCSGQDCVLSNETSTGIQVTNNSCADYYLYFVAYARGAPVDAGADAPHE